MYPRRRTPAAPSAVLPATARKRRTRPMWTMGSCAAAARRLWWEARDRGSGRMRFSVDRTGFADAVGWTARNLPLRTATPLLAGVLLRLRGGRLHVSSFDYEVSSEAEVEVETGSDGDALVS